MIVDVDASEVPQAFLDALVIGLKNHRIHQSEFLRLFASRRLTLSELRAFSIQWLKTTRAHKLAFPHLIGNITDDETRFELIDILYEEYGSGDPKQIHALLLDRFLRSIDVSDVDVEMTPVITEVKAFTQTLSETWKDGDEVIALGLHFSLEHLAATLMPTISDALEQYTDLSAHDREYFLFHSTVETMHAGQANHGVLRCAMRGQKNRAKLEEGIEMGTRIMQDLYDGFYRCIRNN